MKNPWLIIASIVLAFSCFPTADISSNANYASISSPLSIDVAPTSNSTGFLYSSWPGLHDGWMQFSRGVGEVNFPLYDPTGYIWTTVDRDFYRWNIETGEVHVIPFDSPEGLPYVGGVVMFASIHEKTWVVTRVGDVAYYSDGKWVAGESISYQKTLPNGTSTFPTQYTISSTADRIWASGTYIDYSTCPGNNGNALMALPSSCIQRHPVIYYFDGLTWKTFSDMPEKYADSDYYVTQSGDGSFWFWSGYHVLQYDGNMWREYKNLRGAKVFTLSDRTLLFVFDAMIIFFDGEHLSPLVFPGNRFYYPIDRSYLTPEGNLWVRLRNSYNDPALQKDLTYLIQNGQIKKAEDLNFENAPDDGINFSYQVDTPRGWLFRSFNGFYLYDGERWRKYEKPNSSQAYPAVDGLILGFTADGSLWSVDNKGIKRFDGTKKEYVLEGEFCFPSNSYPWQEKGITFRMDAKGNIWAAKVNDNILCYFDAKTRKVSTFELAFNVNTFALSPTGNIWVATKDGYLGKLSLDFLKKDSYREIDMINIGGDSVRHPLNPLRIEIDVKGMVWIFAENSGLYRYNRQGWKYYGLSELQDPSAFAIDTLGQIVAGLPGVILRHDGINWIQHPIEQENNRDVIPSRMALGWEGLWFVDNSMYGGQSKVYRRYGPGPSDFPSVYSDSSLINKIIFAPDGAVWFVNPYSSLARYKRGD